MLLLSDVFTRLKHDNQIICAFVAVIFYSCTIISQSLLIAFVLPNRCVTMKKKNTTDRFGSRATSSHQCCRLVWTAFGPGGGQPSHIGWAALVRTFNRTGSHKGFIQLILGETSKLPLFRECLSLRWDAEQRSTIPLRESVTCGRVCHPWSLAPVISPHISLAFTSSIFITFMTPSLFCVVGQCSLYHCHLTAQVPGSRGLSGLSGNLSERMSTIRFYGLASQCFQF